VDEAHTLPTRLLEELRLLTNVPTPLPAVHIVLSGSQKLEETLGLPRMESLAQRIAVRAYLEPLDHAETLAYLRTQTHAAGLDWERLFGAGCDDAVFTATDGVPRLINQLCDQALVTATEAGRQVTPADIATAWGEIQRLPVPPAIARIGTCDAWSPARHDAESHAEFGIDGETIEFGGLDDDAERHRITATCGPIDPWLGPDVELVFDGATDPFEEFFEQEERVVERYLVRGPDDFRGHAQVMNRDGSGLGRLLADFEREAEATLDPVGTSPPASTPVEELRAVSRLHPEPAAEPVRMETALEDDDTDMVVIEEDIDEPAAAERAEVFTVRPGDYRSLFTRLRRGDRGR